VSPRADIAETLRVAEQVLAALQRLHAEAVIIGGMALAVHRYPRDTIDLDLAAAIERVSLPALGRERQGIVVEVQPVLR
jgi:hypothetical protein